MKQIDLLQKDLQRNIKEFGEDAPSVKDLKRQIASLEYSQETGSQSAQETFLTLSKPK